jgi:hypothetical protein
MAGRAAIRRPQRDQVLAHPRGMSRKVSETSNNDGLIPAARRALPSANPPCRSAGQGL